MPPGTVGPWAMQAKPGIIALRPLALGEIFDGSFQAIRSNPRTMIGLSAVVLAVVTAVTVWPEAALLSGAGSTLTNAAPTFADAMNQASGSLEASGVRTFITVIAVQIITAMLVLAVSNAVLGRRLGPGEAWARVRGRLFAVLGLAFLQALIGLAAVVVPVLPGVAVGLAGAPVPGIVLGSLGLLGGVVLALYLATKLTFSGPALLLEEQPLLASMRRSFQLIRGSFWRVFWIILLTQVIVFIGTAVISTPFAVASMVIQFTTAGDHPYASFWGTIGQLSVQGVGQVIAGAVFYPFAAAVTTLLYIDVRMRREGLDVELLRAAEAGPTA